MKKQLQKTLLKLIVALVVVVCGTTISVNAANIFGDITGNTTTLAKTGSLPTQFLPTINLSLENNQGNVNFIALGLEPNFGRGPNAELVNTIFLTNLLTNN